jgi:regulator of replication initiation timing
MMTTTLRAPEVLDQIASLKEDNVRLVEANLVLRQENEALKTEAEALKAKIAKLSTAIEAEDNVEIVAVPAKAGVKVPDLYCGKRMCERKEVDGYTHFTVPRKFAEALLTNTSGLKYLLVGQKEPLKAKRRTDLAVEDVTVYPYVLGEAGWKRADGK